MRSILTKPYVGNHMESNKTRSLDFIVVSHDRCGADPVRFCMHAATSLNEPCYSMIM